MATFIAVLCVVAVVLSIPLVVLRPNWVFYIFLFFKISENLFAGYIAAANNLGMPRTWLPGDLLWILVLAAAFFVRREERFHSGVIGKCLIIASLLSVFSLLQGLALYSASALTYSRVVHLVAAVVFGIKYFTNYHRVNTFLRFVILTVILMCALHVLIRFGVYTPPVSEDIRGTGLIGERGTYALVPMLYLAMIAIGIGRLSSKYGHFVISACCILVGAFGIVLTETRSTYGAAAILVFSSVILVRGRIKVVMMSGLAIAVVLHVATVLGFDFLARFEESYGTNFFDISPAFEEGSARGMEYRILASSYKENPAFLLTGRGVGALHRAVAGTGDQFGGSVGYYHSEYLGWLDRCGIAGLITLVTMMLAALWRSLMLTRCEVQPVRCYSAIAFLLLAGLLAEGVFHPVLSHVRAASVLVCFVVIVANWQQIYYYFYQEQEAFYEQAYNECTCCQPDSSLVGSEESVIYE